MSRSGITYPNVPIAPGVPPIPRDPDAEIPTPPPALTEDTVSSIGTYPGYPQWGVFDQNNVSVILYDSFVDFAFKQDWTIADYTIEEGGFQSYDKVQLPYDVRTKLSCGGNVAHRNAFLTSIQAIQNDTNLYDVVTPDEVYTGLNLKHVDYTRTNTNGVGLILADLWFQEIRPAPEPAFSNTTTPSGASPQFIGNQQPVEANPGQSVLVNQYVTSGTQYSPGNS